MRPSGVTLHSRTFVGFVELIASNIFGPDAVLAGGAFSARMHSRERKQNEGENYGTAFPGIICAEGNLWRDQRRLSSEWLRKMGMTKFGPARATLEARIVAGVNELVQVRNLFPFFLLWLFLGFFHRLSNSLWLLLPGMLSKHCLLRFELTFSGGCVGFVRRT